MERVSADTIREVLTLNPEITVEQFILKLKEKWEEHINSVFDREIAMVVREYQEALNALIQESNLN